ncbi:frequency clock protein-domain-containing protein [Poronia punctata]|nr:frequency clock protein-domain-containing protein [Poronia punctata]
MSNAENTRGIDPSLPPVTYKNPRRTSPESSTTLRNHRVARDLSRQNLAAIAAGSRQVAPEDRQISPLRESSGEWSDGKHWFNKSNENGVTTFNASSMDIDPPFFQNETCSSNEAIRNVLSQSPGYRFAHERRPTPHRSHFAQSNSADDFRSVIDDLTVENKRLREELRKLKQTGPDSLRSDKLFEVKVHGLPSKKKRELEAALRDFTTSIEGSSTGASTSRKKASRKSRDANSLGSKHASSASGSHSRPVDSAYASLGTNLSSSSQLAPAQAKANRLQSNQKIQNYLRDIPEGLWPKPVLMTENEKKKLVVKRLEQLFTGKMGAIAGNPLFGGPPEPIAEDMVMETSGKLESMGGAAREALIGSRDGAEKTSHSNSRDTASGLGTQSQSRQRSNSNGDRPASGEGLKDDGSGSVNGSGSRNSSSPQDGGENADQRPTRPRDLDPDRTQVPADNMEYIRHLGIVAPESQTRFSARDVSPDANGWVYLNLLCNLAQLHILNVTPDFIRTAVSEKSTRFQLSPDGAKIRWRGGDEGTKFTSDSGSNSQRASDDTDGSNGLDQRKKQKRSRFNLGRQGSASESFHYKPLFLHHQTSSSDDQPSGGDESGSSSGQQYSRLGWASKRDQNGDSSGPSQRKSRRDGAIIYYSGAPFCTDLSGDYGEVSLDAYDVSSSSGPAPREFFHRVVHRPSINRSASGSSIPFKPLSDPKSLDALYDDDGDDMNHPGVASGESDEPIQVDFPWSEYKQRSTLTDLEASGLSGVSPDDHFLVVVSTKRPKLATNNEDSDSDVDEDDDESASSDDEHTSPATRPRQLIRPSHETVDSQRTTATEDSVASKLAHMWTGSPMAPQGSSRPSRPTRKAPAVRIQYLQAQMHRLPPTPLPPAAYYRPSDDSELDDCGSAGEEESWSSERSILSKRAFMEASPDSDHRNLSGDDEEDDDWLSDPRFISRESISSRRTGRTAKLPGTTRRGVEGMSLAPLAKVRTESSVATTTENAASGYDSSMEDA